MKIRHPGLLQLLGLASSAVVRSLLGTLTYHYRPLGPNADPGQQGGLDTRYIYAMWHENMILPCRYSRRDVHILVSQHADGTLIAGVCSHMGCGVVRGSTTRGGIEALGQMLKLSRSSHLFITPDGPRGPRRKVQPGLVYLASRTGLPIMPVGIGYQRPWRLKSWDRFAIPRPFSLGVGVSDQPIHVPANASRDVLDRYRQIVENEMNRLGDIAEEWAATGIWPRGSRSLFPSIGQDAKQAVA